VQKVDNTNTVFEKQLSRTLRAAQDKLRAVRDRKDETIIYSTSKKKASHNGKKLDLKPLSVLPFNAAISCETIAVASVTG
jgi:hypothetical protein